VFRIIIIITIILIDNSNINPQFIMSALSRNSTFIHEYNFSFYIDKNNNNNNLNNKNNSKLARETHSRLQNRQQQQQPSQLQQTKPPHSQSQIFNFQFRPNTIGTASTTSTKPPRPQSKGSRLHQILLTNQSSLNNILFDTFSCDSNSSMSSYSRTPRTPRFTYNNEASLSVLVKKPFKHYVESVKSGAMSSSSSHSTSKQVKSNSSDHMNTSSTFEETASNTKFNAGPSEVRNKIKFNKNFF
jgi:hypothetical protein